MDWNAIVREHAPTVFRAAWRILGQSADAEDVTQEVFLEAYQFQRSRAIRSWPAMLRRMAVCRALDRLRRRRPDVSINDRSLMSSCADPESDAIAAELSARLSEAIGQLPEREAQVVCLRYFEDLSNQEIADLLEMQAGAVAAALHRARGKLESSLRSHLQGDQR
jgi:RNA polymerase sigma-70 factor (ECF subfamily)